MSSPADEVDDAEASLPPTLLRGICSLEFENHSFVPDELGTAYWLTVAPNAMEFLSNTLGRELEFCGKFEAKFFGTINEATGAGHLNLFAGDAYMQKVVWARLVAAQQGGR